MLTENEKKKEVKLFRLLNGEEILAEVIDETTGSYKIQNPIKVVLMPTRADPKTPTIAFAPWCEFTDDKVLSIKKDHVLLKMNPIIEFLNQYNSLFGKLVVPSSTQKLILPGNQ